MRKSSPGLVHHCRAGVKPGSSACIKGEVQPPPDAPWRPAGKNLALVIAPAIRAMGAASLTNGIRRGPLTNPNRSPRSASVALRIRRAVAGPAAHRRRGENEPAIDGLVGLATEWIRERGGGLGKSLRLRVEGKVSKRRRRRLIGIAARPPQLPRDWRRSPEPAGLLSAESGPRSGIGRR